MIHFPEKLRNITGDTIRPGGLALTERAVRFCGFTTRSRLVDIGCGFGATVDYLQQRLQCHTWGVDQSPEMLKQNRKHRIVQAHAEFLPFGSGIFDGVFCECVLSLVPFPARALSEFHRVLSSSGYLVISDIYQRNPQPVGNPVKASAQSCLQGAVSQDEQISRMTASGLELILWEDHSETLKSLAAGLVWETGSLEALMKILFPDARNPVGYQEMQRFRPGYFLLIAQKRR